MLFTHRIILNTDWLNCSMQFSAIIWTQTKLNYAQGCSSCVQETIMSGFYSFWKKKNQLHALNICTRAIFYTHLVNNASSLASWSFPYKTWPVDHEMIHRVLLCCILCTCFYSTFFVCRILQSVEVDFLYMKAKSHNHVRHAMRYVYA